MMRKLLIPLVVLCLGVVAAPVAAAKDDVAVQKPVKTLISAVRYGKDDLALKNLAGEEQGAFLLGEAWNTATAAQKKEFVSLFHALFAGIAFPRIRENFEHLETVLYEAPATEGETAKVGSTIVILHPLKKQELKASYVLAQTKTGWKVLDVTVLGTGGKSMLTEIRDDQVGPIFAEVGFDGLLALMRERLAEVKKSAKK